MAVEKTPNVPPFVSYCAQLIPTVFDNSLSYYEALAALAKWLQDNVVEVINNNATITEEYIQLTKDMKEYMDNYFDNLDVQEEINNKLDAMAEDGTLQEIITTYIQANTAWCFNTVNDMKLSENLINGSYTQTLGFHSLNDGGGALYYITDTATANEKDIIAVGDLYAILVPENEVKVEQLGAYGDKLHDDTAVLQYAGSHYHHLVMSKSYKISGAIELIDDSVIDGKNTGLIYAEPSELENKYIFSVTGKSNVTIKNINFESENLYSTIARPDHPNWNSSVSSNIVAMLFFGGCKHITVKNITSKYMYNEINFNSNSDSGFNEDIVIENYVSREVTSSAFFFGFCKNTYVKNIDCVASSLPLPGVHFMYVGHNGGENWTIEDSKYVGNQYTIAALALAYASFIPDSVTTDAPHLITVNNCDITCPRCVNLQNDKIVANFNNCKFTFMKRLNSSNNKEWVGCICPAGTNNGYYRFFNCQFMRDSSEDTNIDSLTYYSDVTVAHSYNDKIIFDNCVISGVDNLTYYNSLTGETIISNSDLDIERAIFRRSKYSGNYMLNNCKVKQTRAYLISGSGTATDKYVVKDNYILSDSTSALINNDNSNAYAELYNNVIETQRATDYITGSANSNVSAYNTLVNKTILTI